MSAQATQFPHPTVAPPSSTLLIDKSQLSVTFNVPNMVWDHGEGSVKDVGGVLGHDDAAFAEILDKVLFGPHEDSSWASSILRYVGHGRDVGATKEEAAFEILVSALPPLKDAEPLIVLWMWPTIGAKDNNIHAYRGLPQAPFHGLQGSTSSNIVERPRPAEPLFADLASRNIQLYSVHFVGPWGGHPLGFEMQRAVQVLKTVRKVLARTSTPEMHRIAESVEVPCLAAGSSYSSSLARLLPYHYPQLFHAGYSAAFPASMLRGKDDQTMHDCLVRLEGHALGGNGWSANSQFNFSHWAGQRAVLGNAAQHSFYGDSFFTRETSGEPYQRPIVFYYGDADVVTHATDFLAAVHDVATTLVPSSSGAGEVFSPYGKFRTYSGGPEHSWMVLPMRCHSVEPLERYMPYTLPSGQATAWPHTEMEAVKFAIDECLAEFALNRSVTTPPWTVTAPFPPTVSTNPHQHFLARGIYTDTGAVAGTKPDLLTEVPAVSMPTLTNCGVGLGIDDSMIVDSALGILTGSAEGIVSRVQPLTYVVQAQSVELGYGVFALAVGEFDAARTGREVVAGSYGWIHVLDGTTLQVLRSLDLKALGWQYLDPRSLRAAELDGKSTGNEIVFFTKNDRVVILSSQLQILSAYFEPGILDLVLGPATGKPEYTQHPVFSSARGQLYRLGMAPGTDSPSTELMAVSPPVRQFVHDLEVHGGLIYGVCFRSQCDDEPPGQGGVSLHMGCDDACAGGCAGQVGYGPSTRVRGFPRSRLGGLDQRWCDLRGDPLWSRRQEARALCQASGWRRAKIASSHLRARFRVERNVACPLLRRPVLQPDADLVDGCRALRARRHDSWRRSGRIAHAAFGEHDCDLGDGRTGFQAVLG